MKKLFFALVLLVITADAAMACREWVCYTDFFGNLVCRCR